jgi:hypothetical protein
MIIPPHIFCKIQGKTFFPNSSLSCKSSFKISPESFKSIYVITLLIRILTLAMFYQAMHIAFSSYSRITLPGIRAYCGTWLYTLLYKRNKGLCFDIRDDLCPHLSFATQNPKHRCLLSSPASFRKTDLLRSPFVFPLSPKVRFINLNRSTEYSGNIIRHDSSYHQQCSHDSLSLKSCFLSNVMARKTLKKRHQQRVPLRCRQSKGQTIWLPLVSASQATPFLPANYIGFRVIASRTSMSFCHATNVSYLVARMGLYPFFSIPSVKRGMS